MKNWSKRTRTITTIAAAVVVLAGAVAVVMTMTPVRGLLGFGSYQILPPNPSIYVGQTIALQPVMGICGVLGSWSVSNPSVLGGAGSGQACIHHEFVGLAPGQAVVTFKADGPFGASGSTTVTVNPLVSMECVLGPDTGKSDPHLGIGERMTVCCRADYQPQFALARVDPPDALYLTGSGYAPGCIVVVANAREGNSADLRAYDTLPNTADSVMSFWASDEWTINPAYPTVKVGQSITLNNPQQWTGTFALLNCPADCPISLTRINATSTTVTGLRRGAALVTFDPDANPGMGLTQVWVEP